MRTKILVILLIVLGVGGGLGAYREGVQKGYRDGYRVGHQRGVQEGQATGRAQGDAEGYKRGKMEGHQAGLKQGLEQGKRQGWDAGFKAGHGSGGRQMVGAIREIWTPALVVFHIDFGYSSIAQALVYNNTPERFTSVELVLNPNDAGGYVHRIPTLEPGDSIKVGQGRFYSQAGRTFPDGSVVLECLFRGRRGNDWVEEPGLVFDPR